MEFFPFWLFFTIARHTNSMLRKARKPLTSTAEIKAWFGIRMLMGIIKFSDMGHYWSSVPPMGSPVIKRTMTRDRFYQISSYPSCADKSGSPEQYGDPQHQFFSKRVRPLYFVQTVWDEVKRNCQSKFRPGKWLSLDEGMVGYKGFLSWIKRVSIPMKPTKTGFKIFGIAELKSGYLLTFDIQRIELKNNVDMIIGLAAPFLGKYHRIFTDRAYTSVKVAKALLENRTYLTGPVRRNSGELPGSLTRLSPQYKSRGH